MTTSQKEIYLLHFISIATDMFLLSLKQHICFTMKSLLNQIKTRRIQMKLKQHDMLMRIGMSRQQYQRLESRGNPRLETLALIAKGLNSEILLVPQEKLQTVIAVLEEVSVNTPTSDTSGTEHKWRVSDDPWKGLLGDDE